MARCKTVCLTTTMLTGVLLALAASPALAQNDPNQPAANPPPAASTETKTDQAKGGTAVDELVVTGSRIRRTDFTTASPVQIITTDDAKLEGHINAVDVLQRSTIAAGSAQLNNQLGGFVVNGGSGIESVSLRGLGGQRTLVLLNGRRLNPAGVSGTVAAVDLNVIPSALIERYEILKDGASSIYGSDAIGGVVNIITKSKFDGLTMETNDSFPTRGHGNNYDFAVSGGRVRDNYHVLFGAEFSQTDALRIRDLPGGACPLELQRAPGQSGFKYGRFNQDGTPYCANPQTDDVQTFIENQLYIYDPTQPANFPYVKFQQDPFPTNPRHTNIATDPREGDVDASGFARHFSATLIGGVDLPHGMEFYFEDLITNRQSHQNAYLPQVFPSSSTDIVAVSFNPFNPFNDYVQPVLSAPISQFSENVTAGRALFGLRGNFGDSGFLSGWKWDGSVTYGGSRARYVTHPRLQSRFNNALDVVVAPSGFNPNLVRHNPVDGKDYTCAIDITDPGEGCYPLNFFESHTAFTTDPALAYISATDIGHTRYDQVVASATFDGPLFHLPAGEVQGVLGFEYRYDKLYDNPGKFAVARDYFGQSTAGITQGDESVGEVYAEVEVPLIKDFPLVQSLTINGSGRFTDYRTAGTGWTYKASVNWQVVPSIRIRGTYGTSFRGPALYENYLAAQTSFTGAVDPCQNYGINGDPSSNLFKNCASEGLPGNFPGYSSTPEVFSQGALGRLTPETSKNITVGPVWSPSFIDLQVAFDYFHIEVDNEIAQLGPSNILSLCYGSNEFRSGSPYCTLVGARDTNHNINLIDDSYINIARQITAGFDVTVRYRHKFEFGEFRADMDVTKTITDDQELIPGTGLTSFNGTFGEPKLVWNADLRFKHKAWTVLWNIFYLGNQEEYSQTGENPAGRYNQYQPRQFYHTVSLSYEAEKWTATIGIQNLTDKYPPRISNSPDTGFAPRLGEFAGGYGNLQLNGRTIFVNLKHDF